MEKKNRSSVNSGEAIDSGAEETSSKFSMTDLSMYSEVARKKIKSYGFERLWGLRRKLIGADRLNIRKTVAVCYAGLLLLQEPIILADITRWIREGSFPYLNAYHLMPEDMSVTYLDKNFVRSIYPPSPDTLTMETRKLLHFLKINTLPVQPVVHLAVRFIVDLNLPNEMASAIHRLVTDVCPSLYNFMCTRHKIVGSNNFPYYDLQAATLVVIALKFVFGLDGKTERSLSRYAKEANNRRQIGRQTFVWDDWEEQANMNLNLQKHRNVFSHLYSAKEALDVGTLHAFCKESKLQPDAKIAAHDPAIERSRTKCKAFKPLFKEKNLAFPQASSFPMKSCISHVVSGEHEVAFYLRDFSSHSLPRKEFDRDDAKSFAFVKTPAIDNRQTALHKQKYLACLPSSQRVLLNCLSYITNMPLRKLIGKLRTVEKLIILKLRSRAKDDSESE